MSDNKEVTTIMRGALILSLSSLIAKILSAFYRIPLEILDSMFTNKFIHYMELE